MKPCPKCFGNRTGIVVKSPVDGETVYYITCLECGYTTAPKGTEAEAKQEWEVE